MTYCIGIDIGGTAIKAGLVDGKGTITLYREMPTGSDTAESISSAVCGATASIIGESTNAVSGIGIGVPGIVSLDGRISSFANIRSLEGFPLAESVRKSIGIPVYVDNDANCAVTGELLFGAAKGTKNCILITLGTGIGAGIIINGGLYRGSRGAAGEAGHMVIVPGGRKCGCGNLGCWEAYGSASALALSARESNVLNASSLVNISLEKIDAKAIVAEAIKGDPLSVYLFDEYVRYLGIGIANLLNLFDPDMVVIGGGVSRAGDFLFDKVRESAYSLATPSNKNVPIVKAALGNMAGIAGSASLPFMALRPDCR